MPKPKNLNPICCITLRPTDVTFIKKVLTDHQPIVKMRLSERAMETASAQILADEIVGTNLSLSLLKWSEITHALAVRWKRCSGLDPATRCMTLFRWIKQRLRAEPETSAVLDYWDAVEQAEKATQNAERAADEARLKAEHAAERLRLVRAGRK